MHDHDCENEAVYDYKNIGSQDYDYDYNYENEAIYDYENEADHEREDWEFDYEGTNDHKHEDAYPAKHADACTDHGAPHFTAPVTKGATSIVDLIILQ